ncbi:hypothetical protein SNEBB_001458 [Seison nebaliae]|nr:hypothetical protein SNEBB_001458 [Seison nebaliae]
MNNQVHAVGRKSTKKSRTKKAYNDFLKRMATTKKSVTDRTKTIGRRLRKKKVAPIPLPTRKPVDELIVPESDMTSTVNYTDLVKAKEWWRPTKSCTIIGAKGSISLASAVNPLPVKSTIERARWIELTLVKSDMKSELFKAEIRQLKEWHRDSSLFDTPSFFERRRAFKKIKRWISGRLSKKSRIGIKK